MRVPAGFQTYLKSIGFEDFQEPFVLEVKGKEYEFLTSDGKEITEFPGWDAITLACETALAIGVCRATRDLEELQCVSWSASKAGRVERHREDLFRRPWESEPLPKLGKLG